MATMKSLGLDDNLLPEMGLGDMEYSGGLNARAPQQSASALGQDASTGLGLPQATAAPTPSVSAAVPPPTTPTPQPPEVFQPPATPTPATPTPTPMSSAESYKTIDQAIFRPITEADATAIQRFMDQRGITIGKSWRGELAQNPKEFMKKYWGNGVGQLLYNQLKTGMQDPNAAQNKISELNNKQFEEALGRLETSTGYGGRDAEEELMAGLAQRGLLDSGIAARELQAFRAQKYARLSEASSRLNEILYSNAAEDVRRDAMLRLQAQLQLENQTALANLQAKLQQQQQDSAHQNDFMGFLGDIAGTAAPFLIPGAGIPLGIANIAKDASTGGGVFGVDNPYDTQPDNPYAFEVGA